MKRVKDLFLIVISGPAGAGKTTLADFLHDDLSHTAHIGSDHIKRFISEFREVKTHDEITRKVINAMTEEYLKNGISVIVDQGMNRKEVESLSLIAEKHKADFLAYAVFADRSVLEQRTRERSKTLNKPVISKEHMDLIMKRHEDNDYPYTTIFDSSKLNTKEIAEFILVDLNID